MVFPLSMAKQVSGNANDDWRRAHDFNFLDLMARLKPGETLDRTNAEVNALFETFVRGQASSKTYKHEVIQESGEAP